MQEHRAATEKQLLEHEAEQLRRKSATRERVLARLWDIRRPQLRRNQGKRHQPDQGPGHDRGTRRTNPRPSCALRGKIRSALARANVSSRVAAEAKRRQTIRPSRRSGNRIAHLSPRIHTRAPEPSMTPSPTLNQEDPTVPHSMTFAEEHSSPYTSFVPDTRNASLFQSLSFPAAAAESQPGDAKPRKTIQFCSNL